jgi:hypothetical protein
MKSGLWLAILFNVAAVAILAVVTFMGGNGAASRNPYASRRSAAVWADRDRTPP